MPSPEARCGLPAELEWRRGPPCAWPHCFGRDCGSGDSSCIPGAAAGAPRTGHRLGCDETISRAARGPSVAQGCQARR
eukprot:278496-Chlamydomonas_euryale.AAC.1